MSTNDFMDKPVLGIILPDDPIDSEMHHLGDWLARHGRADVDASTMLSKATGGHFEDDLFATGDLEVIEPCARALVDRGCGVIVWACTSGSFIGGLDWARKQAESLQKAGGVPATSTTLAFIAAIQSLGQSRVHLLGAYPEPVTQALMRCLGEAGIAVEQWCALGTPDGPASFHLDLRAEVQRFADTLADDAAIPILIPDTAINSLDFVEILEETTGRTVLAANQVSLWHGLRLLGVDDAVPGAGHLLGGTRLRAEA